MTLLVVIVLLLFVATFVGWGFGAWPVGLFLGLIVAFGVASVSGV